jgi:tetratricopeptide (TPR) repeat protein
MEKALEFNYRSLKARTEIDDKRGIAMSLNNIAGIYEKKLESAKAIEFYKRSLKIKEEILDKEGMATTLHNLGRIYFEKGDPFENSSRERSAKVGASKALEYFTSSLQIREEIGDKVGIGYSLNDLGSVYLRNRKYALAKQYASEALLISRQIGMPENIKNSARLLYSIYKSSGDHKAALDNYELFITMRDSINNEANRKASVRSQLKYEYEKQAAADSVAHAKENEVRSAELSRQAAELRARKNQQYALFGGLFAVCVFGGVMFNRYKVTQRQKLVIETQKSEVEAQKKLVEEKQQEVLDSIRYAKRIQMAQIPSEKRIEGMLIRSREG